MKNAMARKRTPRELAEEAMLARERALHKARSDRSGEDAPLLAPGTLDTIMAWHPSWTLDWVRRKMGGK